MEMDIIKSHMFPINMKIKPRYKESYVVTLVDKIACGYERFAICKYKTAFNIGKGMIYMFLICSN